MEVGKHKKRNQITPTYQYVHDSYVGGPLGEDDYF
jgi:hypothetical protein